jgi:uncharacterized protein
MNKRIHTWVELSLLFLVITSSNASYSASFDCSKAFSKIEKAICASPQLGALDVELDRLYRAELERTPDVAGERDAVRTRQREWLRDTRNTCPGEQCLEMAYRQRVNALKEAQTSYQEAKANAEQEDKNPPPGVEPTKAAAPSTTTATGTTPVAESASADSVQVAAPPVPSATPGAVTGKATERSSDPQSLKEPGMGAVSYILLALALLLPLPIIWFSYKALKAKMGLFAAATISAACGGLAFVVSGVLATMTATDEYKQWRTAKNEKTKSEGAGLTAKIERELVGAWTMDEREKASCGLKGSAGYMIRHPDGTAEFMGDDGSVVAKRTLKVVTAYSSDVGAIEVRSDDGQLIYWVAKAAGDSLTTMRVASVPKDEASARKKLDGNATPDFPGDTPSTQYKCSNIKPRPTEAVAVGQEIVDKTKRGRAVPVKEGVMDARATHFEYGGLLVVTKINESETSWYEAIKVRCSWRDKVGEDVKNSGEFFWPGARAGNTIKKWNDGSPISDTLVKLDTYHVRGPSKAAEDSDIPRCLAVSAVPVTKEEVDKAKGPTENNVSAIDELMSKFSTRGPRCPSNVVSQTVGAISKINELKRYGQLSAAENLASQQLMILKSVGCISR